MAGALGAVSALGSAGRTRRTRAVPAGRLLAGSLVLAAVTVLAQIAYPLTPDRQLGRLSVVTVLVFAAASLTHAVATRGRRWTLRFALVVVGGAFVAEAVGVATGFPFGHYSYAGSLGPRLLDVPVLVPLAWLMMAYPVSLMARTLTTGLLAPQRIWAQRLVRALVGGAALAAWDIFLDPQMVAAGHWTWADPTPGLPGVTGVPLSNLAGWLFAGSVVLGLADLVRPDAGPPDGGGPEDPDGRLTRAAAGTPAVLLGWTWAGGVIGNAAFFDRPAVALWGGAALGLFVLPTLLRGPDRWPQ